MPPEVHGQSGLPDIDLDIAISHVGTAWEVLRGQNIFITGGTGFVGKWLLATLKHARQAHQLNCRITILSRHPHNFARDYSFMDPTWMKMSKGDVRDFTFPQGEHAVVIHAATDVARQSYSKDMLETCGAGTERVLAFAKQAHVKKFHLVSSGAVYGRQPNDMSAMPESYSWSDSATEDLDAYTLGKRQAELLTRNAQSQSACSFTISRCFATVGPMLPLDGRFAIGNFMSDVLHGRDIQLKGNGASVRSYLYAADLAGWLWAIILRGKSGSIYNVGSAQSISIHELAIQVAASLASTAQIHHGSTIESTQRFVPDISLIANELGLVQTVNLAEAIQKTASHYDWKIQ
jgi:dTDP-glucose 4,6-dehydratase